MVQLSMESESELSDAIGGHITTVDLKNRKNLSYIGEIKVGNPP